MPEDPYSLNDLARLADVTPRTVRYYVAQGLLPAPEAAGPATRYGEGHLARLRLIKRLQRDHLPLAEIRGRIERLGDDEVHDLLGVQPEPPPAASAETLAFVRDIMARSGVTPRVAESRARYQRSEATFEPTIPDAFPAPSAPVMTPPGTGPSIAVPAAPPPARLPSIPSPPGPGRSTWERHVLAPDVELHVRRPLDRLQNKRVDQLIRIARELLEDDA